MASFILNDYSYTSSVTCILEYLNWATLAQSRTEAKLIFLYKIVNNILHILTDKILIITSLPYSTWSHHTHHYTVPPARL